MDRAGFAERVTVTHPVTQGRKTLIKTKSPEFRRNSMRRDGRVVDGGGLESIKGLSSEFAFSA